MKAATITSAALAICASVSAAAVDKRGPDSFLLATGSYSVADNDLCVAFSTKDTESAFALLTNCSSTSAATFYQEGNAILTRDLKTTGTSSVFATAPKNGEEWGPVVIKNGAGTNFTYSSQNGFLSQPTNTTFVACNWAIGPGALQLFVYADQEYQEPTGVSTCATVGLVKKYVGAVQG